MTKNATSELETTRLTISWSKQADLALRSFLGARGVKKGDISRFIKEAVRWRIFHQTVTEAREAFVDVPPDEIQKMIDEGVEDVRAKRYLQTLRKRRKRALHLRGKLKRELVAKLQKTAAALRASWR
ncbi:MAG: ribbon-helix-helix domain-containing protein [Terriglobia bacterium]|jgi:hypothetical protein